MSDIFRYYIKALRKRGAKLGKFTFLQIERRHSGFCFSLRKRSCQAKPTDKKSAGEKSTPNLISYLDHSRLFTEKKRARVYSTWGLNFCNRIYFRKAEEFDTPPPGERSFILSPEQNWVTGRSELHTVHLKGGLQNMTKGYII